MLTSFLRIPFEFVLFGLTLVGVALFHRRTMVVALVGLGLITGYKVLVAGFASGPGLLGLVDHFEHEWVVLAIQDEGCGIAPEDVEGIFQPFRSSFERGTGLGLATVHRVVTDYNGTINVASQVGVGTIMSVRLPVHAGISATPAESESRSVVA